MSQSTKVVFLLDVASFFSRDDRLCVANYQHAVNAVKYCCLKFLTHFGTKRTRWGYKFYSSNGLARQRMEKRLFCEFNLENFEDFEDDLVRRFEHYRQACEAIDRSGSCNVPEKDPPCSVLRAALTQVFSEYQWDAPSLSSPVKWKSRKRKRNCVSEPCEGEEEVNYIFNISPCPRTDGDVAAFLRKAPATEGEVADYILPAHLRHLLLASAAVKFFWIDTTPLESGRKVFVGGAAWASPKLRAAVAALGGHVISVATLVSAGSVGHVADGRGTTLQRPLGAVPFSDVADFYLSKATVKSPQKTATVVYRETQVGSAVLCAGSAPEGSAAAEGWKEIRILCRARQDPKMCIFQSSRVQTFCCVEAGKGCAAPVDCLAEMLSRLANDGSAFFVEVALEQSPVTLFGFLFPIDCALFCVHIVSEPGPWVSGALLEDISSTCSDGSGSELKCILQRITAGSLITKPFTADVLERWFVPASVSPRTQGSCRQGPSSSQESMLRTLQQEYRAKFSTGKDKAEQRLMSDQPLRPVAAAQKLRKFNSASVPIGSASSTVGGREAALPSRGDAVPTRSCSDIDQLVAQLRRSYDGALNSELPASLLTCAQNIVSVVKRFAESEGNELNSAEAARNLLRAHFTVGCVQIAEKYANLKDDTSFKHRVREYQLQALLALEEEVNFRETSNCVERVTSLLRTLSFIYNPASASEFLKGIVCSTYLATLKDILIEIGEELNIPIFSDEHDSSLASEGDFFQLGSIPSLHSQESYLSSIPSSLNLQRGADNNANAAESKTLTRVGLSQPLAPETRQIVVKQASKRKATDAMVAKKPAKKAKTKDAQGSENEASRERPKQNPPSTPKAKRRRVLKTTFVPETPHRKQGRKAVQRRQELLRKKFRVTVTLPVVEETPEKKYPSAPTTSKSQTPLRAVTPEPLRNAAVQCAQASTTPKRSLRPKTLFSQLQTTPPEWNGSECLFISPASEVSLERLPRGEKTPNKCGLSTGNDSESGSEHCFLTPRRRVSKKLLSSPTTPKSTFSHLSAVEASPAMKRALSQSPSTSFQLLSPRTETPRRLFSLKRCDSPALRVLNTGDIAITTSVGFDEHLRSTSSEQTLPVDSGAASTGSSQSSASSPVLAECTSRFTRSKSRETGLTPHQLFILSQKSPVKDRSPASKRRTNNTVGGTPRHGVSQKVSYTPPSALSLLHLTSSPMLLKKSK